MNKKAIVLIPESLFIVFKRDTFERITYDGQHWKLNFPLAYELYQKDPKKMCMYHIMNDADSCKQILAEMTESEIKSVATSLRCALTSCLGIEMFKA